MAIVEDAKKGELKCKSRVLHRMMPVLASCRADLDKVDECVLQAIEVYLTTENLSLPSDVTYKSVVKVRNNNNKEISQTKIIGKIGETLRDNRPLWRVNLSDPNIYIVVDILKTVCCVSVIHRFLLYKKFNLQELVASHHTAQAIASSSNDSRVKCAGEATSKNAEEIFQSAEEITSNCAEVGSNHAAPDSAEKNYVSGVDLSPVSTAVVETAVTADVDIGVVSSVETTHA